MATDDFGEQMHIRGQIEALLKLQLTIQEKINELEAQVKQPV